MRKRTFRRFGNVVNNMRDIIFRGKRTDNGKWVEGFYVLDPQANEGKESQIYYTNKHPCGWALVPFEVIPETVGQYTGLTDKNGKKIFENGYLIIDKQTYKVAFNNGEYILTNIFDCDIIQLKNNSSIGVFVDEI